MTNKNKNKIFGIIATIVFHAVAVVLLLTLCFRTPLPLPGEAGVEVNLGMYAAAMNQQTSEPASIPEEKVEKQEEKAEETEDILSEDEEIPYIEEKKEEVEEETEEPEKIEEVIEEEVVEEIPVVNQRAIFQVPKNNTNVTSEGKDEGSGEQGSANGLKDINRYEGNGGSGVGPAYDLGGRGAKSISSPNKDFNEEGKIVVDIWVDKEGRVQRAEIGRGTTIINETMRRSALTAASNSIFNKDDKATDLQRGTITYTFIIRQ